jgi:hypothetical protein
MNAERGINAEWCDASMLSRVLLPAQKKYYIPFPIRIILSVCNMILKSSASEMFSI